jgi:hypothetical protein
MTDSGNVPVKEYLDELHNSGIAENKKLYKMNVFSMRLLWEIKYFCCIILQKHQKRFLRKKSKLLYSAIGN